MCVHAQIYIRMCVYMYIQMNTLLHFESYLVRIFLCHIFFPVTRSKPLNQT